MAKRFTIEIMMDLAKAIGANPNKFMGTRSNISFLGTGPQKNPLFQAPLQIKNYLQNRGSSMLDEVNDAMGYLTSGKLNTIQSEILGKNLTGIKNILHPPPLPTASVTDIAPGIEGLRRFPKESHKFFGRPLKEKDFAEIKDLDMARLEKGVDDLGRKWGWKYNTKSKLPEPGTGDVAFMKSSMAQGTTMSRAIARQILQQDTRLTLKPEELFMLKEGKGDPLNLMRKYYGESMLKYDDFLNQVNFDAASPTEFAEMILKHVKLTPQFARGGLARILEV